MICHNFFCNSAKEEDQQPFSFNTVEEQPQLDILPLP